MVISRQNQEGDRSLTYVSLISAHVLILKLLSLIFSHEPAHYSPDTSHRLRSVVCVKEVKPFRTLRIQFVPWLTRNIVLSIIRFR